MTETLALVVAVVLVAFAIGVVGTWRLLPKPAPPQEPQLPAHLLEELSDLRALKAQWDNPPPDHQHLWKREPDIRKMGWMRFSCALGNCAATEWRRS